jgi:uncharacterized protein (TIGR03435 family)
VRNHTFGFALAVIATTFDPSAPTAAQDVGPTFDVVSIKWNTSVIGPGYRSNVVVWRPDGGVTMTNVTPSSIVARAYNTIPADMGGIPDWDRNERLDVAATSALIHATPEDRIAMLRAMLADRFKLTAHAEKRQQPVYDLVLARKDGRLGPGLKPVETDCARIEAERATAAEAALKAGTPQQLPQGRPDFKAPPLQCTMRTIGAMIRDRGGDGLGRLGDLMEGEGTMDSLANNLRFTMLRRVVNKTGLAGSYRVTMNFDSRSGRGGPELIATDGAASVFTAIQEQLGLKLESSRIDVETVVIDHIERPTEN